MFTVGETNGIFYVFLTPSPVNIGVKYVSFSQFLSHS